MMLAKNKRGANPVLETEKPANQVRVLTAQICQPCNRAEETEMP